MPARRGRGAALVDIGADGAAEHGLTRWELVPQRGADGHRAELPQGVVPLAVVAPGAVDQLAAWFRSGFFLVGTIPDGSPRGQFPSGSAALRLHYAARAERYSRPDASDLLTWMASDPPDHSLPKFGQSARWSPSPAQPRCEPPDTERSFRGYGGSG